MGEGPAGDACPLYGTGNPPSPTEEGWETGDISPLAHPSPASPIEDEEQVTVPVPYGGGAKGGWRCLPSPTPPSPGWEWGQGVWGRCPHPIPNPPPHPQPPPFPPPTPPSRWGWRTGARPPSPTPPPFPHSLRMGELFWSTIPNEGVEGGLRMSVIPNLPRPPPAEDRDDLLVSHPKLRGGEGGLRMYTISNPPLPPVKDEDGSPILIPTRGLGEVEDDSHPLPPLPPLVLGAGRSPVPPPQRGGWR
ncbi:hypothetical protein DPEC_G00113040 [Dallia pectoralis]|uniref:Uncharacterized protein n=1 Tax=Dallia pectoralis TaxID=75939 RepID=A0ACC2GTL7_DALPE|nr:hypothetical protein DPEC_G00113040 [Dallia pectoralis]